VVAEIAAKIAAEIATKESAPPTSYTEMDRMMFPPARVARRVFRLPRFLLAALGALAVAASAQTTRASLVPGLGLAELTESAARVVVGEVLSVRSDWAKDRRFIYTTIEVQVAESWKGATPAGGRIKIVQPGGSVGDIEMRVHGLRSFQAGQRAILFLSQGDPAWTVGLGQGHRPLRFDTAQRRWMVDPGDRSAVVRSPTVQQEAADGVQTLEDLRQRVRALVGR
jgi:hypothetical protein